MIRVYREAVRLFARYLDEAGMPTTVAAITREHVESFLARELERVAATSVHIRRYRALQQFFKWAVSDGEIAVSPMVNMKPPVVPGAPVPVSATTI